MITPVLKIYCGCMRLQYVHNQQILKCSCNVHAFLICRAGFFHCTHVPFTYVVAGFYHRHLHIHTS